MPQLDITTYTAQLFWLFLSFGILLAGFWTLLPRLSRALEARATHISNLVDQARIVEERTEILLDAQEERLAAAKRDAKQKMRQEIETVHDSLYQEKQRVSSEIAHIFHREKSVIEKDFSEARARLDHETPTLGKELLNKATSAYMKKRAKQGRSS